MPLTHRTATSAGVTLVELMVVMTIVGILAALTYPSYTRYLQRTRRADAVVTLLQIQLAQERWRATHPGYADALTSLNLGTLAAETSGHYKVSMRLDGSGNYIATATANGVQLNDKACAALSLTVQDGQPRQLSEGTAPADQCWGLR